MEKLFSINYIVALRYCLGLVLLADGVDKFFNLIADWQAYIAPVALEAWPWSTFAFLAMLGIIEVVIAGFMLIKPKIGGILMAALMLGIAGNLVIAERFYNIALVDLIVAASALAVAQYYRKS